jgi:hypothetical protein
MLSNIINSARGYHPVATGDMEVANTHIMNLPLRQGDYKHNKNILDYILSAPAQKKSHLQEVFRKEGVDFAIDAVVTAGVTAATYFVTTALIARTPEVMQMMITSDNPSLIQEKVSTYLNAPDSQKELAAFMVKAQVAAGIGTSIVLTQAFSRAFGNLGTSVSALLKALCHPQEGQEHEAKLKLLAFRKIAEKVTVAIRDLPPHIQEKAEEALEDLKGEIHRMSSTAFARDANDVKKAADKLFLYFALPLEVEDTYQLGINGNKDLAAQFNKDQTELAKSFDEPLCTQLEYIMILHRYSTINQSVLPINVWLEGPTAVGKTYFVENMAKIFHDKWWATKILRKMCIELIC